MTPTFADTGRALGYVNTAPPDKPSECERVATAVAARGHAHKLLDALREGQDVPTPWPGMKRPEPLSCVLSEMGYDAEKRLLLEAVHLVLTGKYEASSATLIKFATAVAAVYGQEMTEAV